MSSINQLRVGLIGCGYQGQWLARAAAEVEAFELVAYTDPDDEAAAAVTAIASLGQRTRFAELLVQRDDIDVVFVATPHHLLQPYALQAVEAGKHVLAEKPMALNAEQAMELETAVVHSGITFMAGYSFRYFPPVAQARQLIADGVIGDIQTVSAGMSLPGIPAGWLADPASGGGMLGFFGCHMVDRVLWMVNDRPVEVVANVKYHPEYGVDQTSMFQVRFEQGVIAQFNICGSSAGWFDFAHFCGRAGHIYLALAEIPRYALTVSSKVNEEYATPQTTTLNLDRPTAIQQKLVAELQEFAQAIRDQRQPAITVMDGRKVLQVLDAVILSGQTGHPVTLKSNPVDDSF